MEEIQQEKEYPIIVLEDPTPFQYDIFVSTVKQVQNLKLYRSKLFEDYKDFDKYSKIETTIKDGKKIVTYKTNDYRIYYLIARASSHIYAMFNFNASVNGYINKAYPNKNTLMHELDKIKLSWLDTSGNKLPADLQPLCTLTLPTASEVRSFNNAVMQELDNFDVFTLVSIADATHINYYLKRKTLQGIFDVEYIFNLRKTAINAGLSALSEATRETFVYYDEVGNKNTEPETWARTISYCDANHINPRDICTLEEDVEKIKFILNSLEPIKDFRPVIVFKSGEQNIHRVINSLLKKFLTSSGFGRIEPIDMSNIITQAIETNYGNFEICYARTNLLQNFIIQRALSLYKIVKNNRNTSLSHIPFVVGVAGTIYPAQYMPVCSMYYQNNLCEDVTTALQIANTCATNTFDFDVIDYGYKANIYIRVKPDHTFRSGNLNSMKDTKTKALSQLKKQKVVFSALDDSGQQVSKYQNHSTTHYLNRALPDISREL